jgi:hypothetical protein
VLHAVKVLVFEISFCDFALNFNVFRTTMMYMFHGVARRIPHIISNLNTNSTLHDSILATPYNDCPESASAVKKVKSESVSVYMG